MGEAVVAAHNVFVYGSLLADDVVRVLLNRVPTSSAALLNGFHRFSIKGRVYPAILPVRNRHVSGRVLMGITDPELHILDEFEDVEYQRTRVEVSLLLILRSSRKVLTNYKPTLMCGATLVILTCTAIGILRNGNKCTRKAS
ncbi:AIG2-like protein D isoform X2 [Gossypium hirsutum]|uniref:Putative gamma-glutamylcyclotransferase n=1 Tax=Gossypium hirsutum TaxID=3635 RepID=A0A1U8MLD7_GOSHI|nr:AIG2-like protein D isoform X2 [Gossypium hirsutum]